MGLRSYAALLSAIIAGFFLPDLASAQQQQPPSGWSPYSVNLLRSNKDEEKIGDVEWRSSTFPVYILPIEGGSQPVVRIEAGLKHRDWAIFWNNIQIRRSEQTEMFFVLEIPLQGEYTPVELFASRNVVQLEREIVMLHFPKWKETRFAQDLLERRAEGASPSRMGTRMTAMLGADMYSVSTALTTSIAARLQAHTGLGSSGRFRVGLGVWFTAAELAKTNSAAAYLRRELDVYVGYTLGSRFRFSLFGGMTSFTLSNTVTNGGVTIAGPLIMPSIELPIGQKFILTFTPRLAIYDSQGASETPIEIGTQLHFQFGPREKGSFALILDGRAYDTTATPTLITLFAGLGYSL